LRSPGPCTWSLVAFEKGREDTIITHYYAWQNYVWQMKIWVLSRGSTALYVLSSSDLHTFLSRPSETGWPSLVRTGSLQPSGSHSVCPGCCSRESICHLRRPWRFPSVARPQLSHGWEFHDCIQFKWTTV
jgi:hypothetical protein